MQRHELETPVAVVDLDRLEANIKRLQTYLDEHQIANKPHIKTHKIPAIAQMQLDAGAAAITCQKVGEAEVMAAAGVSEIFLPYNIIGESKLKRLMALAKTVDLSVTVDSEFTLRGLSEAAARDGVSIEVLVEFDTGLNRCGVQTPEEAASLARLINELPGVTFGGLMTYPYNENTDPFVRGTRDLLAGDELPIKRVSVGNTPRMWQAHTCEEATEYRAGMYIYGDRYTLNSGALTLEDVAFSVIATVVSRPTEDRGILDSGSKTLSSDLVGLEGHGLILEYPDAVIYGLSEEHAHVDFSACESKPSIGERVTVIPNHCCPVTNLFDQIVGLRGDTVEVVWDVAARGKLT